MLVWDFVTDVLASTEDGVLLGFCEIYCAEIGLHHCRGKNSTGNAAESSFTLASSLFHLSPNMNISSPPFIIPFLHYPHLPLSCMPSLSCSLTAAPPSLGFLLLRLGNVCSHVSDPLQEPLFVSFSPVSQDENRLSRRSAEARNLESRCRQSCLCYHETDSSS